MFRISDEDINMVLKNKRRSMINLAEIVYWLQPNLGPVEDDPAAKYLNSWNSARSDLVCKIVPLPRNWSTTLMPHQELFGKDWLMLKPKGDISYWLATYLLGFDDKELEVLCPDARSDEPQLLSLLVSCYRRLKEVRIKNLDLYTYHRSRYLLLRYYLDAVYHAIN
jgi:hypothetical protein